jgi:hypothetical protein
MSRFVIEHGDWMHHESGRRYVSMVDGAHTGADPRQMRLRGRCVARVWAVNLYVVGR